MLHRRLTALLASLLLLPSILSGGGEGCIMGGLLSVRSDAASTVHDHGEDAARRPHSDALVHETDTSSPIGVPHAPTQCVLTMGCGSAVAAAAVIVIDEPAHVVGSLETDVALEPESPAVALEPPPPRS
jgi:hypothetical protein